MRTEWRHFRAPPTQFRSPDVINVIFVKTAITPSIFKLKTSNKTKQIHDVFYNNLNKKNDTFLKNIREKHLSKCNHAYKVLHVYISVTVPDSLNSYFLYINNERI